ncbi:MAG: hypothetical protein K8F25_11940 [Fimbriimonadaceae bacterium]|nr:hypothetical protein [Alphaproteobacteria bacterium]
MSCGPACGGIVARWRTSGIVALHGYRPGDEAIVVTPDTGGWKDVIVGPGGAALKGQSRNGADVSAVRIYP